MMVLAPVVFCNLLNEEYWSVGFRYPVYLVFGFYLKIMQNDIAPAISNLSTPFILLSEYK